MSFQVGCTIAGTVIAVTYFKNNSSKPVNSTNLNVRVQQVQARVLKAEHAVPVAIISRQTSIQRTPSLTHRHH